MDSNVLVALISGVFSVISALGAVFLKDFLDTRRLRLAKPHGRTPARELPAAEVQQPQAPVVLAAVSRSRSWTRPVAIVAASFVLGMATRAVRHRGPGFHYESLALVLLILMTLVLSFYHRRSGFQLSYQLEVVALWTGWASGWSLINGGVWSDLLAETIPWWLGCAT